jgi:O-antigen/teichoic acid export membrane protein
VQCHGENKNPNSLSLLRIKSLAKDSLIYGTAGIISRMITIFLVPVYTRIFLPSDYGVINLINVTFFLAGIISVFALDNATARWVYDTNEENDKKRSVASWFWFQLILTVGLVIILISSGSLFRSYLIKVPVTDFWEIWLLPCFTLITNILPNLIWNWYRFNRKPKATLIFVLSQSLLTVCLTIAFVVFLKWGIKGVYAALFISSFLFSVVALLQLKDWIAWKFFDKKRLFEMIRFSVPMIPAALAFWLINSTNSYFLLYFKDQSEVGLFSVGVSLASGVTLFTGAFTQAWGPFAFSIMNEPDAKKTYANVFLTFGVICSIILLFMFLFSPELLYILTTPQYYQAAWVASILSINIILIAFTYIAVIGTSIVKNTTHYSTGVILGSFVTIILNFVFIPFWGKEGSAVATVLAQLIVPVYIFYQAQKLYYINYNFKIVTLVILSSVLIGVIGRYIQPDDWFTSVTIKMGLILFFILYISFLFRDKLRPHLVRFTHGKLSVNLNQKV